MSVRFDTVNKKRLSKLLGQLNKNDANSRSKEIPPPKNIYIKHPSTFPKPARTFWGKNEDEKMNDKNIYKMDPSTIFSSNNQEMDMMKKYIDLWLESNKNNRFHHAVKQDSSHWEVLSKMKGIGYGIDFDDFYKLLTFWKNGFNLNQQLTKLNAFNHFKTKIQGLDIHFIRESSNGDNQNNKCTVDAILCLHGWPGSFWEFHKIINGLKSRFSNNNIDIIIPSLPGFGYSEYPMYYSSFNIIAVASIMKDLMEKRLKYKHYIVSCGDFGAHISECMAYQSCLETDGNRKLLGLLLNDTWTSGRDINENSPIDLQKYSKTIYRLLSFTGYQHIQCHRPNTMGIALESSPIAILSWIYEMYLGGTDGPISLNKIKYDINGNRIIGGEINWNDVIFTAMLYWLNGRITSSSHYYADNMRLCYTEKRYYYIPKNIAVGIVDWNGSSGFAPYNQYHFRNIIYFNKENVGGHFSALEKPQQYIHNIIKFVNLF